MYVPKHFEETDREILLDLIDDYGFATVISWGKFKLGQNKSATDQSGAFAGLASETSAEGQALAKFAERYFGRRPFT